VESRIARDDARVTGASNGGSTVFYRGELMRRSMVDPTGRIAIVAIPFLKIIRAPLRNAQVKTIKIVVMTVAPQRSGTLSKLLAFWILRYLDQSYHSAPLCSIKCMHDVVPVE